MSNAASTSPSLPAEVRSVLVGFLDYLQAECGLSLNTRRAYRRDLTAFLTALAAPTAAHLERVTASDIENFLRQRKALNRSVATICRELAAIRISDGAARNAVVLRGSSLTYNGTAIDFASPGPKNRK